MFARNKFNVTMLDSACRLIAITVSKNCLSGKKTDYYKTQSIMLSVLVVIINYILNILI